MTANDLIAAFEALAESPDGVKRLRELVLQLAVRGKLVPQEAGSVNTTLSKNPPGPGEVPFELPNTWNWFRLPEVADYAVGKTPATKEPRFWGSREIPWVSIGDMPDGGVVTTTNRTVTANAAEEVFRRPPVKSGTLLMSFKLTIGKIAVLGVDAYHNEAIISVSPKINVTRDYLFWVLPMMALGGESKEAIMGATLNGQSLARILIPLPPLAEQHRIVARVAELMSLLDRLEAARAQRDELRRAARDAALAALRDAEDSEAVEAAWGRIAGHMDTLFAEPGDVAPLRQAVLGLAVRGRLNARPESVDTSWPMTRLGDLATLITKGTTPTSVGFAYQSSGVRFIKVENLRRGLIAHDLIDCFIDDDAHAALSRSQLKAGDVLFSIAGTIGKTALVGPGDLPANTNQALAIVRAPSDTISPSYLKLVLDSFVAESVRDKARGGAMMNVSLGDLRALVLPVPTLKFQAAVVRTVVQFMALCDTLEARLTAAQELHTAFAAAAVHHLDV